MNNTKSLSELVNQVPSIPQLADTVARIAKIIERKYPSTPGVSESLLSDWRGNWGEVSELPVSFGRVVQGVTRRDKDPILLSSMVRTYVVKGTSGTAPFVELEMDFEFNPNNSIFVPEKSAFLAFILSPEDEDLLWFGTSDWSYETNHPKYAVLKLFNCEIIH